MSFPTEPRSAFPLERAPEPVASDDRLHRAEQLAAKVLGSWPALSADLIAGYTAVVTYPADLPGLLQLSLRTLAAADPTGRKKVVLVSDDLTGERPISTSAVDAELAERLGCPIEAVELSPIEKRLIHASPGGSLRHWGQIVAGTRATPTRYVLLHDADLVFDDPGFPARHFRETEAQSLACRGAETVWDPWYAEHGFAHVVGTWEMMADVAWLRSFAPLDLRPHPAAIGELSHEFDTLLWAQSMSDPDRFRCSTEAPFHHFGNLVCTFRDFEVRDPSTPFADDHGRLVVLRILHDALGAPAAPLLPTWDELVAAVEQRSALLRLPEPRRSEAMQRSLRLLRRVGELVFSETEFSALEVALAPFESEVIS